MVKQLTKMGVDTASLCTQDGVFRCITAVCPYYLLGKTVLVVDSRKCPYHIQNRLDGLIVEGNHVVFIVYPDQKNE